jgi:hypothetical protein
MKLKIKHLFCAGLAGALALITHNASAQWQTVDNYQYAAGQSAGNYGLAVAPNGIVFAAGDAIGPDGFDHALVRASADGGKTWLAPLDDFTGGPGNDAYYNAVACDAAGNIYAAGIYYDDAGLGPNHWVVRRSTDGGATWSTVDDYVSAPDAWATEPNAIAADAAGNVYVVGYYNDDSANGYGWIVRKGIGGSNFATVGTLPSGWPGATSIFVHPTAGIFVAGQSYIFVNGHGVSAWIVRRSQDGGATWSTMDAFYGSVSTGRATTYYQGQPLAIGADAFGNIYVAGELAIPNKSFLALWEWVVRKSSNGGNSWSTVDTFQLSTGYSAWASAFVADSNGNLFAAGWGSGKWIVRENPGGIGTWQTVDVVAGVADAITADRLGHVFVGGSGNGHWLVRKH